MNQQVVRGLDLSGGGAAKFDATSRRQSDHGANPSRDVGHEGVEIRPCYVATRRLHVPDALVQDGIASRGLLDVGHLAQANVGTLSIPQG